MDNRRRVLITGAGSGLGLALAHRYARSGARVACVDLIADRTEAAAAALSGSGHLALVADVGDDASMVETTMEEWRKVLDVDLVGVVRGCRLFLPAMLAARRGQIINTASFAGLAGAPGMMSYGVAKAAVVALSEQLRAETHHHGVGVSVICPAFFRTNLLETAFASDKIKAKVLKLMDNSPDTLEGVADKVFAAAERGDFMIIPTKREPMRWRMKRWLPGVYFTQVLKLAGQRTRTADKP
jgi:NAD(P)-dependent dehydrogenase (short-subunit alcohol dehydrogenase family)